VARVLALDYGSARCGCALSDPTGTLATPIEVVERPGTRKGMGRILGLIRQHAVATVVVGLPLGLSGADTAQTAEARAFAALLRERVGERVEVVLEDERFTTRLAQRSGGSSTAEDSRAAAILLEGWLARHDVTSSGAP
jgi:putative Holliday junction resolvase